MSGDQAVHRNLMDEECQKDKISADEVIFFTSLEAKS